MKARVEELKRQRVINSVVDERQITEPKTSYRSEIKKLHWQAFELVARWESRGNEGGWRRYSMSMEGGWASTQKRYLRKLA